MLSLLSYIWIIINLYSKLNSNDWASMGKIIEVPNNNNLVKNLKELSFLNNIDAGELKRTDFWVDGEYLNEIQNLEQPIKELILYGLNQCTQQTLYVKITTTTDMSIDVHMPMNSPQQMNIYSHAKQWKQSINLIKIIDNYGGNHYAYELQTSKENHNNMNLNILQPLSQNIIKDKK